MLGDGIVCLQFWVTVTLSLYNGVKAILDRGKRLLKQFRATRKMPTRP
jgi:hypothetical protein